MKTAVSIPDDLFRQADCLARRSGKSRSQIFAEALRNYLALHSPDEITEAMNQAVDELGTPAQEFAAAAARRTLKNVEW